MKHLLVEVGVSSCLIIVFLIGVSLIHAGAPRASVLLLYLQKFVELLFAPRQQQFPEIHFDILFVIELFE